MQSENAWWIANEQAIEDVQHDGVDADRQGQRHNCCDREPWLRDQAARRESDVTKKVPHSTAPQ